MTLSESVCAGVSIDMSIRLSHCLSESAYASDTFGQIFLFGSGCPSAAAFKCESDQNLYSAGSLLLLVVGHNPNAHLINAFFLRGMKQFMLCLASSL